MNEKSHKPLTQNICDKCKLHALWSSRILHYPVQTQPTQPHLLLRLIPTLHETMEASNSWAQGWMDTWGFNPHAEHLVCLSANPTYLLALQPLKSPHGLFYSPSVTTQFLAYYLFSTQILSVSKPQVLGKKFCSTKSCFTEIKSEPTRYSSNSNFTSLASLILFLYKSCNPKAYCRGGYIDIFPSWDAFS